MSVGNDLGRCNGNNLSVTCIGNVLDKFHGNHFIAPNILVCVLEMIWMQLVLE